MRSTESKELAIPAEQRTFAGLERKLLIPFLGVVALALFLRLHDLGRLSLWLDEGITVYKMSLSIQKLFAYGELDNVPPLYYLLLHAGRTWIHSDFALRLP